MFLARNYLVTNTNIFGLDLFLFRINFHQTKTTTQLVTTTTTTTPPPTTTTITLILWWIPPR